MNAQLDHWPIAAASSCAGVMLSPAAASIALTVACSRGVGLGRTWCAPHARGAHMCHAFPAQLTQGMHHQSVCTACKSGELEAAPTSKQACHISVSKQCPGSPSRAPPRRHTAPTAGCHATPLAAPPFPSAPPALVACVHPLPSSRLSRQHTPHSTGASLVGGPTASQHGTARHSSCLEAVARGRRCSPSGRPSRTHTRCWAAAWRASGRGRRGRGGQARRRRNAIWVERQCEADRARRGKHELL